MKRSHHTSRVDEPDCATVSGRGLLASLSLHWPSLIPRSLFLGLRIDLCKMTFSLEPTVMKDSRLQFWHGASMHTWSSVRSGNQSLSSSVHIMQPIAPNHQNPAVA